MRSFWHTTWQAKRQADCGTNCWTLGVGAARGPTAGTFPYRGRRRQCRHGTGATPAIMTNDVNFMPRMVYQTVLCKQGRLLDNFWRSWFIKLCRASKGGCWILSAAHGLSNCAVQARAVAGYWMTHMNTLSNTHNKVNKKMCRLYIGTLI